MGVIFNIQKYCINDGPGIRTTVFLKGCPLHCRWCFNPESHSPQPEIGLAKQELCLNCEECLKTCSAGAYYRNENGIIELDYARCMMCFKCVENCSSGRIVKFGTFYTVNDMMDLIMEDEPFYNSSGGGVTFSGGEPLYQIDFLSKILKACKAKKIHTVVETSGYIEWDAMKKLVPNVDLWLLDFKHLDDEKHIFYTGVSNSGIIINLVKLANESNVVIRVPVIPGFNDTFNEIMAIMEYISKVPRLKEVHLLPYKHYGESKYHMINKYYAMNERGKDDKVRAILLDQVIFSVESVFNLKVRVVD